MDAQPDPADTSVTPATNPTPETAPPAASTPAAAPAPAVVAGAPETWPGAFGIYKYSKAAIKVNLGTIILLLIINYVVGGLIEWKGKSVGELIAYLISIVVMLALYSAYIAGVRQQKQSLGEAFNNTLPLILKAIGLYLLVGASIVISALLLIIPFFFVFPRLILVGYFLVDQKMGVMESYKASWDATKGNVGKVYGILGATILMALLMITIIGIPFSIYFLIMYSAATTVLYEFIIKKSPAAAPAPTATPVAPAAGPPAASTPPAPIVQ